MSVNLDGKVVLVAEDQALVGICLTECLEDQGIVSAGPFPSSAETLTWLSGHTPDVAIIDVELKDGACAALARELTRKLVPFVVFSGNPQSSNADPAFASAIWIEKPDTMEHLVAALAQLLERPAPKTRFDQARPN